MAGRTSTAGPVFVHFIPPPLREAGKKDLPWIVHTTEKDSGFKDGGCSEAKHVLFNTLSGFETYVGAPPDQTVRSQ